MWKSLGWASWWQSWNQRPGEGMYIVHEDQVFHSKVWNQGARWKDVKIPPTGWTSWWKSSNQDVSIPLQQGSKSQVQVRGSKTSCSVEFGYFQVMHCITLHTRAYSCILSTALLCRIYNSAHSTAHTVTPIFCGKDQHFLSTILYCTSLYFTVLHCASLCIMVLHCNDNI